VLVRYSGGSTYLVRACNLVPVLEPDLQRADDDHADYYFAASRFPSSSSSSSSSAAAAAAAPLVLPPMVVVVPETNVYRRVAKVHAAPGDTFVEIGCDYGITVDMVRSSLENAGDVPREERQRPRLPPSPASAVKEEEEEEEEDKKKKEEEEKEDKKIRKEEEDEGRVACLGVDKSKESIDIAKQR
jgi:hypothetical protein